MAALVPIANPPNPWRGQHVEWLGEPPTAEVKVYEERARSILSENTSPDLGFRFSLNPYRGCLHACAYCYARRSHQYWDFGAGTDWERKLVVKVNAPERLREHLDKPSWKGEEIVFSGNTDCYQPLEASYRLTRACLEVCRDYRNPVGIITKSALVRRDAELLAELGREARCHVIVSVPFARADLARAIEPAVPTPKVRLAAMAELAAAGVSVGVSLAPLIPGLNDDQMVEVLERAAEAGATTAFTTLVRLSEEVREVFVERLRAALPDRAERVLNGLREMREGELGGRNGFGERMTGAGPRWAATAKLFELTCRRLGINASAVRAARIEETTFRRPSNQLDLFG